MRDLYQELAKQMIEKKTQQFLEKHMQNQAPRPRAEQMPVSFGEDSVLSENMQSHYE